MISSSMRLSLTPSSSVAQPQPTMKTSSPRTDAPISTLDAGQDRTQEEDERIRGWEDKRVQDDGYE